MVGPSLPISKKIIEEKYLDVGESFDGMCVRIARKLADNDTHFQNFLDILRNQRFLPAGRIQAAIGSPKQVTAFNCYVSSIIEDTSPSIMSALSEAWETMRKGGGIGYDFSTIRPRGDLIQSLNSKASGPVSFMGIFDAACRCVQSAGHRRGAQMGVLRVDHPDIMEFIRAKQTPGALTAFNVSVACTDEFMEAVREGGSYWTQFNGEKYTKFDARNVWNIIMDSTWDYAEPGVMFIDRINKMNPLHYCETITTSNPCGEQPLPPNGACLLGSFNLTKYVVKEDRLDNVKAGVKFKFDYDKFVEDINAVIPAMDNIIDNTIYPLRKQEIEAKNKRRMGIGITGTANAIELLGYTYGSDGYITIQNKILETLRDTAYEASIRNAKVKGVFPLFEPDGWLSSGFGQTLPKHIRKAIRATGLRNSHLLSIAPTGTISLGADNISSGIEPTFSHTYDRVIQEFEGPVTYEVSDWLYRTHGIKGRTADQCTPEEHINVQCAAQMYVDSAVSKTCNVGDKTTFEEFSKLYTMAYEGGAKGCTTFRDSGKREGVLKAKASTEEGKACRIDPKTGTRTCDE